MIDTGRDHPGVMRPHMLVPETIWTTREYQSCGAGYQADNMPLAGEEVSEPE